MQQLIRQAIRYLNLLPIIILSLIPIVWFYGKGSVLINGVDTNFPLDPWVWFERRLFVWTDFPNAGSDFSSSVAGIFFHLVQLIPYKMGLDLQNVQLISLIFWFGLIVFSSYILARIILPKKFPVQLLFVVLYSFNIYIFNTWENIKVANLSLIPAIPLALSLLILLKNEALSKRKALFLSSLVGIILSGSGINPSYFLTFLFILALFVLSQILAEFNFKAVKKIVINCSVVIVPIFLVNLFWIMPTAIFVFKNVASTGSIDKIGFTNWVDSLSENTSLLNIMRLQGAWDWYAFDGITGLPLYIPYSLNYFHRLPFILFSFLLPTIVLLSLAFRKRENSVNYLYISFSLMFVIGVFLGVGTHLPTGSFFRWLSVNIPFFTLFRSPWYIFTPLVILSISGLVCLFIYSLQRFRLLVFLSVLVLVLGNLAYSYPLITGKIFRPGRPDSFFVNFPSYVFDSAKWLNSDTSGRIIGYPDDEIENFNWGYRGIESILGLVARREVVFSSLNAPDSPVASIIKELYQAIKRGEGERAYSLASKLNISVLFEKSDERSLAPPLNDKIKANELAKFREWNFYSFPGGPPAPAKIYSPRSVLFGPVGKEGAVVLGTISRDSIMLNPGDTVVLGSDHIKDIAGRILLAKNSQSEDLTNQVYSPSELGNRLVSRDPSVVRFDIASYEDALYEPVLERYQIENFGIDLGQELPVTVDGIENRWIIRNFSDSYIFFEPIKLSAGAHTITIKLDNKSLVPGGDLESGEVYQKDGNGDFRLEENNEGYFLTILNKSERDISANFPVDNFDPAAPYLVQFNYRQVYGNNANVLVGQNNQTTLIKTQVERMPNYPEWQPFSFYYQPVFTPSVMKILLSAPQTEDPLGTKVQYDNLNVFKVFANNLFFIDQKNADFIPPSRVESMKSSSVLYAGEVSGGSDPHIIIFSENYSPAWEIAVFENNGKRINRNFRHFSANLYANGWFIEGTPSNYKFKIFYKTQSLFWLGLVVSVSTLILLAVWANLGSIAKLLKK